MENPTLELLLNRRTIRAFKPQTLTTEQLNTLMEVARQAATSTFLQQCSVIHVTDAQIRSQIRDITTQSYVGANGDLFIFVIDLYRNQQIRHQKGETDGRLHAMDVFLQAMEDTVLTAQNVTTAAESMGLGCVFLGSIQNDAQKMIELLNLPKMTFPLLGLQVGVPDQQPQIKPRLPLKFRTFENQYDYHYELADLADYDEQIHQYYDLRDTNRRVDTFTHQIAQKLTTSLAKRDQILTVLHQQGLCLE
ncbi:NADPH-dependent oxidoreductase [Bombilactobacillus bombi]|uniref:NADPH-dependent oxidoreductase n=1 Tax=Bombilactobacillus bombi TaxID=1303590 RepID=A0A417ZHS2_9LACO|nr:NADPH-dependent oxidoreductase [Bombilactobacillus bombi]RHW51123.1 NADPH-dependent oxidoreductase [Bombilactobacillus bombi]